MRKLYMIASLLMLMAVIPQKAKARMYLPFIDIDTTNIANDITANMSDDEFRAYVDSIYWSNHTKMELVWAEDSGKTGRPPKRVKKNFEYANSLVPNTVAINTSKAVGQIDIESGFSPNGARTYNVPIKGYKFDGVFCPEISLAYNSQGGGGFCGKGWSVSGLQSITRGNKSIYYDNKTEGIKMDANDAFFLNGVRLIRISTTNYEYETEQGNIKVVATVENGIVKCFNVYYPNGQTAVFGSIYATENKLEYPIYSLKDEKGQSIYFNYIIYTNTYQISSITYDVGAAKISFTYDNTRADNITGYKAGVYLNNTYLLKTVKCTRGNNEICTYNLTYTTDDTMSLLTQIDYSANGSSLNPLKFYYGDGSAAKQFDTSSVLLTGGYSYSNRGAMNAVRGRFDYTSGNDGILFYPNQNPYHHIDKNSSWKSHSNNYFENKYDEDDCFFIYNHLQSAAGVDFASYIPLGEGFITLLAADLDGNQEESIIQVNNTYSGTLDILTFTVYRKNAIGFLKRYTRTYYYATAHKDNDGHRSVKPKFYFTGDFNGDGKMEVMAIEAANPFGESDNPSTCYIYDLNNNMTLYSGNLFNFEKIFETSGSKNIGGLDAENQSDKVFTFDYDGDGKSELCHINSSGINIYSFTQSGNSLTAQKVHTYQGLNKNSLKDKYFSIGDFNNDGLMDIVVSSTRDNSGSSYWTFYYSKGNGDFTTLMSSTGPNTKNSTSDFFTQDIDGDGITDIVELTDNNFKCYTVKNNVMTLVATQELAHSKELIVPVSIYSSSLATQFVSLLGTNATLYSYKTNLRTDHALTGMANSYGVVEKNYYFSISESNQGIFNSGYDATYPYVNVVEAIPVLAGSQQYVSGTSVDMQRYRYSNAVAHKQGLGFRGFGSVEADNHRNQTTTMTYEPLNYCVLAKVESPTSESTFTNSVSVDDYKRLKTLVSKKIETDLLRNVTSTTYYTYDTYGNVLTENSTMTGGIATNKTNTYTNLTDVSSKYRLGRLASSSTSTTRNNSQYSEQTYITSYNDLGQPLTIINKVNGNTAKTTTLTYDVNGNITEKSVKPYTSTTARTSTYQYTTGNRMTKATDPLGVWKSYTYNVDGTISATESYIGETVYTYDAFGRMTKEELPDSTENTLSYSWNTANGGRYAITKTSTGKPTKTTVYDPLEREVRTIQTRFNGNLQKVDKVYDSFGNLWKESIPFTSSSPSYWTTFSYDDYDRITTKSEPSGKTTSYSYDNMKTTVNDGTMTTTTCADALGGVVSVTDLAGTITYTLNGAGNPTAISAPSSTGSGITTTITYDSYGRRASIIDPSHGTTLYYYDTSGNLQKETNAKSQSTTYEYDAHGRVTKKVSPDITINYAYNNNLNKLVAVTSSNGTFNIYMYDALGRVSWYREIAGDSKWLLRNYTYSNGRVSAIQYTTQNGLLGTENLTYANGYLSEVKLNNTTTVYKLFSENAFGQPTAVTTGNYNRSYSYTNYGLPTVRNISTGGTTKHVVTYSFNATTGNLSSRSYPMVTKSESFSYDEFHRLTKFRGTTVEYDNNGNITEIGDVGTFAYGTTGKPYAVSEITLANDISVGTQEVTYFSFDRPDMITDNGYSATFTYNGNYDRVKMEMVHNSQNILTRYYLGGCYELDVKPSGTTEKLYLGGGYYNAPAVLVKQGSTSNVYYIYRDYLGSITHILDSNSNIVQHLNYDAWGRLRNPSTLELYSANNQPEPFLGRGYCGHEHLTGLGLINMNARLYDPLIGRFLSPDPYVQAPEHSQSFNRYSYCMNNPLLYKDENGEWFWGTIIAAVTDAIAGVAKHGFNFSQYNWTKTINAWRIDTGMFRGNLQQITNKWTWGIINSTVGELAAHTLNMAGTIKHVTYMDGMLALDGVTGGIDAFTIGHLSFGPKGYKATWKDHLFVHEYGHYIQSQLFGPLYLDIIGGPSYMSYKNISPIGHNHRWFEVDASRRGANHFNKKYGTESKGYDPSRPQDFFSKSYFISGDKKTPYLNPRTPDGKQDHSFKTEGTQTSIWDFILPL